MPKKLPYIPDEIIGNYKPEDFYATKLRFSEAQAKIIEKNHPVFRVSYSGTSAQNHLTKLKKARRDRPIRNYQRALEKLFANYNFIECVNIDDLNKIGGIYLLVLDDQKSFYLGQSKDMRQRIKQHWNTDPNSRWEHILWTIGIDAYSEKYTTAIYYFPVCTKDDYEAYIDVLDEMEMNVIAFAKKYSSEYCLNSCTGGKPQKDMFSRNKSTHSPSNHFIAFSKKPHKNIFYMILDV